MAEIRGISCVAICAVLAWIEPASAQTTPAKPGPAKPASIPVDELPPIPEVVSDEDKIKSVTIVGATLAEEDVVLGASKREQSLGSVASAVTVVTRDRLRRFGYRTVAEAVSQVVGLYIVDDRNISRLGIRGVQLLGDRNTRILVLIDGSPINEPWQQGVDTTYALPIHIDDVARIEVIRGPVSSVYGTNAFLGIINIITLEADRADRAYVRTSIASHGSDLTMSGNAGFSAGSLNRQIRGFLSWREREGEAITIPEFGALPNTNPRVNADGLSAFNGSLVAHLDRLFVQVRAHSRERQLPGAPYDSKVGDRENRNLERQILGEIGYTTELSNEVTLTGRAYVDRYKFEGNLSYAPFPDFRAVGDAFWYGAEVRSLLNLSRHVPRIRRLTVTAGAATEFTRTESRSFEVGSEANAVTVDRDFNIQGLYTEVDLAPASWISFTGGVRFDINSIFENKVSPRGALFLTKDRRYGAKFLYAQGFRNPSVFEAFYKDERRFTPTCAPQCADIGTTLSPEQITSFEAVLWGRPLPGLKVRLSSWHWRMEKIIEETRVFDPTLLTEVLQFGNVFVGLTSQGAEFEASYRDTRGWLGFASAAVAFVRRGDERANNAPVFTGTVGGSTPLIYERFHLSTEAAVISRRRNTRLGTTIATTVDPYVGWNAVVYVPNYKGFDFTLGMRNILGIREQVPTENDYDRKDPEARILTIPGPGREVFVRVGYRL